MDLPSKAVLRRLYTEKAAALPASYLRAASDAVAAQVLRHPAFTAAKTVFVYVSAGTEPDTAEIIRAALAAGKRVFVPRCGPRPHMDAVEITGGTVWKRGAFGIPEPIAGAIAPPDGIDLSVVPCLSATADGVRLGHGGGYYDAFLAAHPCASLCLCFSALLADALPRDAHDAPVDAVLSDPPPARG